MKIFLFLETQQYLSRILANNNNNNKENNNVDHSPDDVVGVASTTATDTSTATNEIDDRKENVLQG